MMIDPSPPVAAALVAMVTVLIYYKDRLAVILRAHSARRELQNIIDARSDGDSKAHVSGIFIHPGEGSRGGCNICSFTLVVDVYAQRC